MLVAFGGAFQCLCCPPPHHWLKCCSIIKQQLFPLVGISWSFSVHTEGMYSQPVVPLGGELCCDSWSLGQRTCTVCRSQIVVP